MNMDHRIGQVRRLALDLRCWQVSEWCLVDGWSDGERSIGPNGVWARARKNHLISCANVSVPADWPVSESYLEISAFGYGLIRFKEPSGETHIYPFNEYSRFFPLPARKCSAEANISPIRDRSVGFVTLGDTWMARVVLLDPVVEAFSRMLESVAEAASVIADPRLKEDLIGRAEEAIASSAWPSSSASYVSRVSDTENLRRHWSVVPVAAHAAPLTSAQKESLAAAAQMLTADLSRIEKGYSPEGSVHLYGYAHTDIEWLWPEEIAVPAVVGQFAGALSQLERFPDYRFGQAQSYMYSLIEEQAPGLFARLAELVRDGRWDLLTGMWVEPDAGMISGESLIRQLLHGQRYFESRFGKRSQVCWLPDTFGFSGALPQLLAGAGIKYFFTTRLPQINDSSLPGNFFKWAGIDGTSVLAYVSSHHEGYQCVPSARSASEIWQNYHDAGLHPHALQPIGYANGIGPTDDDVAHGFELRNIPGLPSVTFTSAEQFFTTAERGIKDKAVPVWQGELQLDRYRGTLTTQGRTKVLHRRAESSLVAAETADVMAAMYTGKPAKPLTDLWRRLLKKQAHDVIGGTCIREVHEQAEDELQRIGDSAQAVAADALAAIAGRVDSGEERCLLFLNPTMSWRQARAVVPGRAEYGQRVLDGTAIASERLVPPLSVAWDSKWASPGVIASGSVLENEFVRVVIGDDGRLVSVRDHRLGVELLTAPANDLHAYLDRPYFWDAWELAPNYRQFQLEPLECTAIEVVEPGPHRAAIQVTSRFRDSVIRQQVRLWAASARIDFATWIDWHERRVLLRTYFPTCIAASYATYECAHGTVRRPVRESSAQGNGEETAHRFADLSGANGGVALLNNGRYGYRVESGLISMSLLRSPVFPDPFADEGQHRLTYSLFPHPGDWLTGGVLAEAEDLNMPLLTAEKDNAKPGTWQAVTTAGLPLALGALKVAENSNGLVLRAYEPAGRHGVARVTLAPGWHLTSELNFLEEAAGRPSFTFSPHQVRTWLAEPGRPPGRESS